MATDVHTSEPLRSACSPAQDGVEAGAPPMGLSSASHSVEVTSSDMLERLYKLQADLLRYEQQEEAHEEDPDRDRPAPPDLEAEVRFVLLSMAKHPQDGLLQVIAMNLLHRLTQRGSASLLEIMLHLGVMPLLGSLLEVHKSNDLIHDAGNRLLTMLLEGTRPQDAKALQSRAQEKQPRLPKYLPYRVNRINKMYMSNILGQPEHPRYYKPATAPVARQSREVEAGTQGEETEERRPSTTWAIPLMKEYEGKEGTGQDADLTIPMRSAIGRREAFGLEWAPSAGRRTAEASSARRRKRQRPQHLPPGESFPHSNPSEVSRHPLVHKIFANRSPRHFSPLRDMMALFQVLDENHSGLLPAVKFRKALGCLGLSLGDEDVQGMLSDFGVKPTDLIDYELFCTSGKIIAAELITAPPGLPLKPWIKRIRHFEQAKAGTTTWTGHKEWFRRRRAKAATWLMRRGLKALQMIRVKEATFQILLQYARRAFAVTYLLSRVQAAYDHVELQKKSVRWLQYRTKHAQKVRTKHIETFHFLRRRGQQAIDALPRPVYKVQVVNYQSLYRVRWLHDKAFAFLRAHGADALAKVQQIQNHKRRQIQEFNELREIGRRAAANEDLQIESKYKVALVDPGLSPEERKQQQWIERQARAIKWLLQRGERAVQHGTDKVETVAYFTLKAEKAIKAWGEREVSLKWLLSKRPHAFMTQENKTQAILYCLERARVTFVLLEARANAVDYLRQRVEVARKCMHGHREAHKYLTDYAQACIAREEARKAATKFLLKKARFAVEHTKVKVRAVFELRRIVDDIRAEMYRATMSVVYKDVIAGVKTDLKIEDRERVDKWKALSAEEVFEIKLREAFQLYDVDRMGDIGRLDFRYLVDNLNLVAKMNKDDFDQFFDMVDKDGSGQIDFDEFAQWMRYEISRTGTAANHNNNKSASFLPLEERALLTVIAQVKKGEVAERDSSTASVADVSNALGNLASLRGTSGNLTGEANNATPPRKGLVTGFSLKNLGSSKKLAVGDGAGDGDDGSVTSVGDWLKGKMGINNHK